MTRGPAPNRRSNPDPAGGDNAPDDRQSRVGDVLRRAYDDTLAEAVPDAFAELLRKLS